MKKMPMRIWIALLGAPSAVLAVLSVDYAMADPACVWRSTLPILALTAVAAAATGTCAVLAWRTPHAHRRAAGGGTPRALLAQVGAGAGALSTFALAAFCVASWIVPICAS
ncbi:putative membrane protein [Burkholderia cenocepacia]|uniref:hypothetical protein n=1 Tax=Burkholderia TaxID=32008 RepID=UPI0004F5EC1E|nr:MULTISPECIES: hypothetical protein [Burkholderia]AIO37833.1 putative membrane protein [Burkholderia cenocepacia]AOK06100.1 hypothetical protein WK25_16230 [Burkholderia latens]MCA8308313.1 hypothetical protein [Burkholderia sp. AU28942]QTO51919.1 hypothetical protein J8I86_27580 [Burkholderia latens]